jgi:predicted membrane metal-binding protein
MNNARGISLLRDQGSPLLTTIYSFRQFALERVYKFFPDPEASLLAGILLGVRTGIPQKVDEAFRLTGTSHVIAISGFNITILAGLFTFVFRRLIGRRRGMALNRPAGHLLYDHGWRQRGSRRAAILAVLGSSGMKWAAANGRTVWQSWRGYVSCNLGLVGYRFSSFPPLG